MGFDVVVLPDHVGAYGPVPLTTLVVMAQTTTTIRLGTLVMNYDLRNPVQLAWEIATLDRLSDGRVELGLGAGHTPQEYGAKGIPLHEPAVGKACLTEGVEVRRRLLDGDSVTHRGEHFELDEAQILPAARERLPILVGGNGQGLLEHAGANADMVGLQGLGRTLASCYSHTVKWDPAWLDTQVDQIRAGAGNRSSQAATRGARLPDAPVRSGTLQGSSPGFPTPDPFIDCATGRTHATDICPAMR